MAAVINALLPVFVTLLLGYFAAWHHDNAGKFAVTLNKMVMTYTLPLSLFAGTVVISASKLVANLPTVAALFAGLTVPFGVGVIVARYVFRRNLGESTLQALAIAFPAVPFIGIPVLGSIFGAEAATLTVAISGLATNLIVVPISIILLSIAAAGGGKAGKVASDKSAPAESPPVGIPGQDVGSKQSVAEKPAIGSIILSSLKEPVVWAPVLAVVLVFTGVALPKPLVSSLQLLGSTTSGVSLFASGIILQAQTPTLSIPIVTSTLGRLAVVPGLALLLLPLVGATGKPMSESVVALAMPSAVMLIILSVRYGVAVKESASVLLYTYVFSALSMTAAVLLTR